MSTGDGDSSVYARIIERVPYGRQVVKIECANHITRCVNDKLHKLSKNTRYPLDSRKLLLEKKNGISRIERIVKAVRISIKRNMGNSSKLKEEIKNMPNHIFGKHINCWYVISFH